MLRKDNYWHLPLDEPSSYLTTFGTPFGRFRFTRLPYGLIVSQDISQKQLDSALEGLSGATGIADDTFTIGSTEQEYGKNLASLMECAWQKGIVFSKEKLQFKGKEVHFFGCTWRCEARQQEGSSHTKHATPKRCQEPTELLGPSQLSYKVLSSPGHHCCTPSSIHEEGSSLHIGPGVWTCILCSQRKSIYFWCVKVLWPSRRNSNPGRCFVEGPWCHPPTEWSTCVLCIKGTHENYSNIKREALGLVWELERLHYFIYGKQCTIQTDHKPLEAIFRKELSSCPAKLQRFVLGALKYNVKVTYVKGTDVPIADALSRVSLQPAAANSQLPQLDICYVTNKLSASQARLQHIWEETTSDPTLNGLREKIFRGWADEREKCPESLYDYWSFREKLTIKDGLILKADWIVVPSSLCREMLSIIHQGYLGREKCLLRARTSIFWPSLTKDVIDLVKECEPCQRHQR